MILWGTRMKLFGPPKNKKKLLQYLFKYKSQLIISSIGGMVFNTVVVLGPIFLGNLIDASGSGLGRQVVFSALYFVGVTAFFQFARFIKRWYMRDQFNRVACDLRQTFVEQIFEKKLPELEKEAVGDLMSRTVGDITIVVDTVMSTINEAWDTWLLMISYFVALMIMDWKIALISSILVPFTIWIAQLMRHVLFKYSMSARKAASVSNNGLLHYLDAISLLRLFGREEDENKEIHKSFEKQANYNIKEMLLQKALLPVYSLIAGLGIVVVIALGGARVVDGNWTIGTFNAFLIMFIAFSGRTRVAAEVFNRWHAASAAWSRVKEKMESTDGMILEENNERFTCSELTVQNLSFNYGNEDVLKNISFSAKKGQIIGVTGAVGSGKTSLAHALTGLYPYEGEIKVDGKELLVLYDNEKKKLLSYTGHEHFLFSMSILDNISFSKIDKKKIEYVLQASALTQDISRFDQGLDTMVGEKGIKVSGGQRQRISMARAIYSDAPILLMDDPFSAVDIATEAEIIKRLKLDYTDRIVIIFTHRLTAFKNVDDILVLDKGKIVEHGTHDELQKNRGLYNEIYNAQAFMGVDINE